MKRLLYVSAFAAIVLLAFTGCETNAPQPQPEPEPQPTSYPKKHLIEEFTGQTCGYCPMGMDYIHAFTGNDSNYITILHHAGYADDNFTIAGSKTISNTLGVSGAPSVCINRDYTEYTDEYGRKKKNIVFHPAYLEDTGREQFESITFASIEIQNTYDSGTKELKVEVSGNVLVDDLSSLYLTVLVKESGMIDKQADYLNTFEGWDEFRHENAVRAFLTAAKGDTVRIQDQKYSATYTLTLADKWVADNCMVVAFLSENFKYIVQAEQTPVVAGTKGGADIVHGGITPVPVPDYYPESSATGGPSDYSRHEADTINAAMAIYTPLPADGVNYWHIQAYDLYASVLINRTACVPFADLYFITEYNASPTSVPTGTYPFVSTYLPGTAEAGFRDDEEMAIGGSQFYYVNKAYLAQGYLVPVAKWLIADGTLVITDTGWSVDGHARNGKEIHIVGTTPITFQGRASAPARTPRKAGKQIEYCK